MLRTLLIIAGSISLILGIIGIFIPMLPTTPFLLLTAACFAKSSPRLHSWLLNNKWFGLYIKNYIEGKGIKKQIKIYVLVLLWATILCSVIFFISLLWVKILLLVIAGGVTFHILKIPGNRL
ncbi:MAG: hypothetical protein A2275_00270 [Bacteroidetes bacterium RIFOXYA12_FULL_35_11]|nr:MAG: hypothetical protein A2X01_20575 [Bacteroidetes bacterium GWF2_35_48]OFY83579.1 MAG: hypothetical protein A2275_00270 [Bacteroidetes bacterium RIFOXYA12_FULL_35_11]HBX51759.1 DUF454 domain-containing protein [Bacteroidales bacterium]